MIGQGIATTDFKGYWGKNPRLYAHVSDGYRTGEYYIDHLSHENLQELADWMITLPEELYQHLAGFHRMVEGFLLNNKF